jgi:putative ABC transport system permease protein
MRLLRRLAHLFRWRSNAAALAEEMAFHRDAIERDLVARGYAPADAGIAARRAMGNETMSREDSRSVWLWPALEGVWQDARCTLRGLRRTPVFTAGVLLTFALGVGANASMFSLVDRLLFRPPAYMHDASSVHRVYMSRTYQGEERPLGGGRYVRYVDLKQWTTSFSVYAGALRTELAVGVGDAARELSIGVVSAEFFGLFDAPPSRGRYFTVSEDTPPNGAPVAVISDALWRTQYGSRPDVIGAKLHIGPVLYEIIGVAPPRFVGLWPERPPVAFIPVTAYGATRSREWATSYGSAIGIQPIVRRKPGVSVDAATADLTNALIRSYQKQNEGVADAPSIAEMRPRAVAASILAQRGPSASSVSKVALWLAGVTVIVLLIACANVANLLLARTISRRRELAVRISLGVSKLRLLSQLLTESVLLAAGGGLAGVFVAAWMSSLLGATFFPGTEPVSLLTDARTLMLIGVVVIVAGIATGVLPLAQARRLTLANDLRSRSGGSHRSRARVALLVLQGALSLVLLVGAGLFVRSVNNVRDVRIGFDADSVLLVEPVLRNVPLDSAQKVALRQRLLAAATSVPRVSHASMRSSIPFLGASSYPMAVAGIDSIDALGDFEFNTVSPDYFATMGTRILRGRGIGPDDVQGSTRVIVIGDSMGRVLWPEQDAIGKCVRIGIQPDTMPCTYVVGIAEDVRTHSLGDEGRRYYYYMSAAQWRPDDGGLFVRVRGDAQSMVDPLRRRLQQEMPGASYVNITPFGEIVAAQRRSWVMGATVFTAFGVLALVLAAVGLYSVIAYDVAQRKHEIAVRVALGAASTDVERLVVGRGLRFGVAGVVAGGAIALGASRWVEPLLFGVSPRDPTVFVTVVLVLLAVAVIASWVPAYRAARLDPKMVLQGE